jgi:acetyl-CoA acyltransferase
VLKGLSAIELGKRCVAELIQRTSLDGNLVEAIVYGTVVPSVVAPNIAREISLMPLLSKGCQAYTVSRACASANQAITDAADQIVLGHHDVIIAGGAESLSTVPILHSRSMSDKLVALSKAKGPARQLRILSSIRPRDLVPITPAIAEVSTGESMGQSAEKMAKINHIPREEQDQFALRSHRLAAAGTQDGRLIAEIMPFYVPPKYEKWETSDNGIRTDTSLEQLAALKPVFDRKYGSVTAGNSSPLTDGAAAVLLMSETKARELGYKPIAYLRSYAYAALDPGEQLLQAPVLAAPVALQRAGLSLGDMDLVEMHEAFAAQVLCNVAALESESFLRDKVGVHAPLGKLPWDRFNPNGGSVAIGHPFGATGARILSQAVKELAPMGPGKRAIVSICADGGVGTVALLET